VICWIEIIGANRGKAKRLRHRLLKEAFRAGCLLHHFQSLLFMVTEAGLRPSFIPLLNATMGQET
jgi:hypothetical protein